MAMKHQNKSIFSRFTFSMAVLDGAHSYLKFDMVISLIQGGVIEYLFPGSWKLS